MHLQSTRFRCKSEISFNFKSPWITILYYILCECVSGIHIRKYGHWN